MPLDPAQKILSLLALIESGSATMGEIENATEAVQRLASTYAIDIERVRHMQKSKEQREELTSKRINVGEPGRQFKNRWWVDLFLAIARSNDLRCTISYDRSVVTAYGYPSDIRMAELLFVSLNTQMVGQCGAALRRGDHKALGVHGATYRLNFYEGFIQTIDYRLAKARRDVMAEQRARDESAAALFAPQMDDGSAMDTVTAGDDGSEQPMTAALVMVKKSQAVGDYYKKETDGKLSRGGYRSIRPKTVNHSAAHHGRTAGNNASLGATRAVGGGARPALPPA